MFIFKKVADLRRHLNTRRRDGQTIGFVPTMGALHQGHASLIKQAAAESNATVCSIFVNPTQFNEANDLAKYPRTPEKDIQLLLECGCTVLFLPEVKEVYPDGELSTLEIDFGQLDQPMEGAHRPGHFAGVAQVVKRLLDIVQPDQLYMGQKDYQQFAIVQHMVQALQLPVKLTMCATVREADGLAMSSRNMRLSAEQRAIAPLVFKALRFAKDKVEQDGPTATVATAMQMLTVPGMEPEYFEIVDGRSLAPVASLADHERVVACTAVRLGDIRLIDNLVLK
ncbi:MAG: pantoate--beta-alanine ligase [Saprospiraceae bacterium]|jgi:pantoate--beta-alanine ligase|nr:pantoate--beta-alanine ligase [Saprospiraceae bacterium]